MSCDHYPLLGPSAKDCWEVVEQSMHHIVRRCRNCGQIETSQLTSYKPGQFMTEKRRRSLDSQRSEYGKDIIQPWKDGKPNEQFAKAYSDEPDKLINTYTQKDLKQLDMPKLAEVKDATHKP